MVTLKTPVVLPPEFLILIGKQNSFVGLSFSFLFSSLSMRNIQSLGLLKSRLTKEQTAAIKEQIAAIAEKMTANIPDISDPRPYAVYLKPPTTPIPFFRVPIHF